MPLRRRILPILLAVSLLPVSGVRGQVEPDPLASEIPLSGLTGLERAQAESDAFWRRDAATRALQSGVYDVAYALSESALENQGAGATYAPLAMVAIDALIAQELWVDAVAGLDRIERSSGAPESELALRRALISFAENDDQKVAEWVEPIDANALDVDDRAWLQFLRGWVALRTDGPDAARSAFEASRALALSQSPALAAQIGFLVFRAQLEERAVDATTIPQLQSAMAENRGRTVGFAYAQQLAAARYDNGETEEAIKLIESELASISPERGQERAQFQVLQTMAAGLDRLEGRQAFQDLMQRNRFPELMSVALQHAFSEARGEPPVGKALLISVLDRIVAQSPEHALLDQALYYRSVFKFLEGDYVGAEEEAVTLQRRFPASPFRRGVLALQASAAWNRNRFRTAASYLRQMQQEFVDLSQSVPLSALIADCYLRAGLQSWTTEDFRNAAEAYSTALSGVTDSSLGGPLFFQLILARLRAGQTDQAIAALDNASLRRLAGAEMIWQAEWMVVKEMRRVGRVADGYDRARAAIALADTDPSLRLRLLWQAVKLSLESGAPEDTEYWTEQVSDFVRSADASAFDAALVEKVKASCQLSLAESRFVLDEPGEAVDLLQGLRRDYPGSESALLSYIAEARYYSSIDQTVDAQRLLVSLADNYPDNRLAPMALYEAAVNAERRGEDTYLDQANKLLQRIANDYPDSEMVYYARLKQADLLRKLNKFGSAERIYEFLEVEYANRPDRYLAQMSLADTLIAQSVEDPAKFEAAISRLELLMDLPEAPLGLRVEAGYKLGQAWRSRGATLRAKQTFWVIYDMSVVDEPRFRALTRKGRYWLARCLFALAEIAKEEGKVDEADQFYGQIVKLGLWGAELAKARLEILEPAAAN